MIKTDELFAEAVSLSVDVRTQLADTFLRTLNPMQKEIDKMWADEAEKRVLRLRRAGAARTKCCSMPYKLLTSKITHPSSP